MSSLWRLKKNSIFSQLHSGCLRLNFNQNVKKRSFLLCSPPPCRHIVLECLWWNASTINTRYHEIFVACDILGVIIVTIIFMLSSTADYHIIISHTKSLTEVKVCTSSMNITGLRIYGSIQHVQYSRNNYKAHSKTRKNTV